MYIKYDNDYYILGTFIKNRMGSAVTTWEKYYYKPGNRIYSNDDMENIFSLNGITTKYISKEEFFQNIPLEHHDEFGRYTNKALPLLIKEILYGESV